MVILGLTGSIGMGKSTAANMLRGMGVPVYDADATVHDLLAPGGEAIPRIEAEFAGVVKNGAVDRSALGDRVFGDRPALARLEAILHPLARRRQHRFLATAARNGAALVVIDVPLLFETGADAACDAVAVVSATAFLQAQRVLSRPGMTAQKFHDILSRQMPDREKRRRADFVVRTGLNKRRTLQQLRRIVRLMESRPGSRWAPGLAAKPRRETSHA